MKCSALSGMSCPKKNYLGLNAMVLILQGNAEGETEWGPQESSYGISRIIKDL